MNTTHIDIPAPLVDFIFAHEIHCVAACCGEDAFDFTPEAIEENKWSEEAISALDLECVRKQLIEFSKDAKALEVEIYNQRLNIGWKNANAIDRWCMTIESLITHAEIYIKSHADLGETGLSD